MIFGNATPKYHKKILQNLINDSVDKIALQRHPEPVEGYKSLIYNMLRQAQHDIFSEILTLSTESYI